jgi:hypothetical protein
MRSCTWYLGLFAGLYYDTVTAMVFGANVWRCCKPIDLHQALEAFRSIL